MDKILEKIIIFVCCGVLAAIEVGDITNLVVPIIVTIAISALSSYYDNEQVHLIFYLIYCGFCLLFPIIIFFIPLILYDVIGEKYSFMAVLGLMLILYHQTLGLLPLGGISIWLKMRTIVMDNLRCQYKTYRDTSVELAISLEDRNKSILQKQEYEIQVAILNERNRIAREVHDNVGHLLSCSILQVGALMAINKDEDMKESINQVRNTLSTGMESIRSSVHNLHDNSVDLKIQVETLINDFKGFKVSFDFSASDNIDKKVKYCFIAIIKEALANIIKHSNATLATITIREHPAILQLIVWDNGVVKRYNTDNGIGLSNIRDRITALNGIVHITTDKGFRVFISVPKEENNEGFNS